MREIKFRGLCEKSNEMVFGDLIHGVAHKVGNTYILPVRHNLASVKHCDPLDGVKVVPESVGQFTGLKDKNGVYIYDGDILNWDYCGSTEWKDWMKEPVYKVIYQDGYFVCAVGITKNLFLHSFRFKYCEVVGNIYQNPELLNTSDS